MKTVTVTLTANDVDVIAFALGVAENEGQLDLSNTENDELWRKFVNMDREMNGVRSCNNYR